jgi:Outer membrane lipoprotein-sorting protein
VSERALGVVRAAVLQVTLLAAITAEPGQPQARGESELSRAVELLRAVDARQQNAGDWRSVVFVEQKQKGRDALIYEMLTMRRSADRKFVMLFTKPKGSQGQGYLRIDRNLWFYDPSVGRWERRTERERIGGTSSRRSDFDEWHLSEEYDPQDGGEQMVGKHATRMLILNGKPDLDLAFPVMRLWVDPETKTVLKRQEFALSGRLLRTTYYPRWEKIFSSFKKAEVWYPKEIRLYDELEAETSTLIIVRDVDARPLAENLFTKAWLEGQSR